MSHMVNNRTLMSQTKSLLEWYQASGVDCAIEEVPVNWLETGKAPDMALLSDLIAAPKQPSSRPSPDPHEGKRTSAKPPSATARPEINHGASNPSLFSSEQLSEQRHASQRKPGPDRSQALSSGHHSITEARALAEQADSLSDLAETIKAFDGCSLKRTAKNTVVFRGSDKARLMIIGEGPGRDEDIEGKPFVGRAGQLLDKMLAAIQLTESDVHITNIVYWRPPGNRTPTLEEGLICRPFLTRQIELVAPQYLMFLGGSAAKQLLDTTTGIMKLRGKWHRFENNDKALPSLPTLHPAYLLRTPIAKRLAWQDLKMLRRALDGEDINV